MFIDRTLSCCLLGRSFAYDAITQVFDPFFQLPPVHAVRCIEAYVTAGETYLHVLPAFFFQIFTYRECAGRAGHPFYLEVNSFHIFLPEPRRLTSARLKCKVTIIFAPVWSSVFNCRT